MEILVILLLVIINGVFSMSEIALVSSRPQRLRQAARRGGKNAKAALELSNAPGRFLSTVQIGITLIGILTGIYSGESLTLSFMAWIETFDTLRPYAHSIAITTVLIIITYASLVIGELVPKRIGLANPEAIAKRVALPMKFISKAVSPFVWFLTKSTDLIIWVLRVKPSSDNKVTEEEIKAIVQEGTTSGEVQEIEQEIVERVFSLGDRKAASLMTYRQDIVTVSASAGPREIKAVVNKELHTVYPVTDKNGEVLGIIHLKDLFLHLDDAGFNVNNYILTPHYFSETLPAYKALELFKTSGKHYALVVDEYGQMQGLLTLDDLLTALVGTIDDLHPDHVIQKREDGSWLVDGNYPVHELMLHFNIDGAITTSYNTIGGLIMDKLHRVPKQGDKISWRGYAIEVIDMDGNRVDKLLMTSVSDQQPGE